VSLPAVLERIATLHSAFAPPAPPPAPPATVAPTAFAAQLQGAVGAQSAGLAAPVTGGGTPAGQAILNLARSELGVTEQPPGSNDSPRIAQYRQATAGAPGPGPWCAYFVSWAAREAGVPIGDSGQGYGLVDDVWAWGERSGKAMPASSGPPQPGDLIVWDEHIGVVESVGADGSITTIEGNSSDSVAHRSYGADGGGAIGWVRLG
jgi:CHAP domain